MGHCSNFRGVRFILRTNIIHLADGYVVYNVVLVMLHVQPKDKFFLPLDNELVPLIISGKLCEYSIGSLLLGRCAPISPVVPTFVTATGPYYYFREAL